MTTKDRIESAAIRLFAEQGIERTAVKEIAQAAGVADGALYRHYPSKDALCRALFAHHYEQLGRLFLEAAKPHQGIAGQLTAIIRTAYELFDNDRALFTFILLTQHDHLPSLGEISATPVDSVCFLIEAAMTSGEIAQGDANELTAIVMGMALQPAIFTVYGRLRGPLTARAASVSAACHQVLSQGSSK